MKTILPAVDSAFGTYSPSVRSNLPPSGEASIEQSSYAPQALLVSSTPSPVSPPLPELTTTPNLGPNELMAITLIILVVFKVFLGR